MRKILEFSTLPHYAITWTYPLPLDREQSGLVAKIRFILVLWGIRYRIGISIASRSLSPSLTTRLMDVNRVRFYRDSIRLHRAVFDRSVFGSVDYLQYPGSETPPTLSGFGWFTPLECRSMFLMVLLRSGEMDASGIRNLSNKHWLIAPLPWKRVPTERRFRRHVGIFRSEGFLW